jgi:putative mRNA 3-end processing factor
VFITESTFGLPIYRWPTVSTLEGELRAFWQRARNEERAAVIFAYALGKSQRILAHLKDEEGPFVVHGAVEKLVEAYRAAGVDLPKTTSVTDLVAAEGKGALKRALVLAPPSAQGTPWMRRFGHPLRGLASGWMAVRGTRRRKALDRGFVLSDHADWPALLSAIDDTGASRVLVTHGHVEPLVRYLNDRGLDAAALATPWAGEQGSEDEGSGLDALDAEEAHVQASAP